MIPSDAGETTSHPSVFTFNELDSGKTKPSNLGRQSPSYIGKVPSDVSEVTSHPSVFIFNKYSFGKARPVNSIGVISLQPGIGYTTFCNNAYVTQPPISSNLIFKGKFT